jgi:hypothetical protein
MDKQRMMDKIAKDVDHRFEFFNYDLDGMLAYLKDYKPYPEKVFEKGVKASQREYKESKRNVETKMKSKRSNRFEEKGNEKESSKRQIEWHRKVESIRRSTEEPTEMPTRSEPK